MANTQWREPETLAAGDTLKFERSIGSYLATDGWSIDYELRGGSQAITFTSTADGSSHSISVAKATTAAWLPGNYTLAGYVTNGTERHQIYEGPFTITPNLPVTEGNAPIQTHAEIMLAKYETALQSIGGNNLLESRIGETSFKYLTPKEFRTEWAYWKELVKNERQIKLAKMGRPTGARIRPVARIIGPQPSIGMFGRGNGFGGY